MKEYEVTLYFHTNLTQIVCAESEEDAIESARSQVELCTNALIDSMQEDDAPDVCVWDDKRLTDKQKKELGYD